VGKEEVEVFEQRVSALQSAGVLQRENAVKWLIAPGGFLPEALECASRHRILVSTTVQAVLLGRLLGKDLGELIPRGVEEVVVGKTLEFEMTIPMVSETELVAARAVEQLAENMNFDPNEIGRIKMALVEACINAFEHSGREDDKVRLRFSSDGRSLAIRVENRGRRFLPLKIGAAGRKKEMTKRGWGLSLIRELMDEVEFEPRDDGASLVMVKHLSGREGGGEQV
jgi:serine/threonine-protein kinase RsbW